MPRPCLIDSNRMLKSLTAAVFTNTRRIFSSRIGSQTLVLGVLIGGWELIGRSVQSPLLPPMSAILTAWLDLIFTAGFQRDLGISLMTMAAGFSLALVSGILLGIMMARFRPLEKLLDPYMNALMSSPITALVPIIMLIFGSQFAARIVVVFLFSFFAICINTLTGVKNADRALIEMVRSLGASDRQITRIVALPGALPMILQGVRLSIARAVGGVLIAELLIVSVGIGLVIMQYTGALETAKLYAAIATVIAMGVLVSYFGQWLDRTISQRHGRRGAFEI